MHPSWPNGHKFAFTIFDDTDWATVDNVKPIYDLLASLGLRTTKSLWVLKPQGPATNPGMTCEDPEYLDWALSLRRQGFEIALHNVSAGSSTREHIARGLGRYRELFGAPPRIHCNHVGCLDNVYWGAHRLSGWPRLVYNLATRGANRSISRGHVEGDPLFWGDLCREQITYVRNFVFDELNTLAVCPEMPYYDPGRPYVNYWFASANGGSLPDFLRNFTCENIDRLVEEGGLCIAYVHFAGDMMKDGRPDPRFRKQIEYIASKDGWFAPVSEMLDYLRSLSPNSDRTIAPAALRRLERRWLINKLVHGSA